MKKFLMLLAAIGIGAATFAEDLTQLYEKAYFLETAKGQPEEALEIYRQIASTKATDENRAAILNTLDRMQHLYRPAATGTLQGKVDAFDMKHGNLESVLLTFGEPKNYVFGNETFTKSNLPNVYVMIYPEQFTILMKEDRIVEFRFEGSKAYEISGIRNGISLKEALGILGKPSQTVRADKIDWEEDTLYLTTGGKWKGQSYIAKKGLRLFFKQDVLFALYVTDNTLLKGK